MSKPAEPIYKRSELSTIIQAPEDERLEYLAVLLLELIDEELQESEADECIQS